MSDHLTFGIIGLGRFGKHYLRLLQEMEGVRLKTAVRNRAEAFAELTSLLPPSIRRSTSADDIFNDPEIDAVVIATPLLTHFELCRRALAAGKHVLVEKPMGRNLKEALTMQAAAKRAGRKLKVGFNHRYHPDLFNKHRLIKSGENG